MLYKTLLLLFLSSLSGFSCAQELVNQYEAGIVFGPKGAFKISAPKDWVLDNQAGKKMGLDCVLYLKGETWSDSPVIMYARIASTQFEDLDQFLAFTLTEFVKTDSNFQSKDHDSGAIKGDRYIIKDYFGGTYKSFERAVYIQMENAIAYVVFSARNQTDFEQYADAIHEVLSSYEYRPEYIQASE